MNNIEHILRESISAESYAEGYLSYISELLKRVDPCAIARFIEEMESAQGQENTVFFAGNGGSAVTASHMANDFGLGSYAGDDSRPYRALSLSDNTAKMTAIANDCGYENLFTHQLRVHYRPGDKLVAISASGNSPNIIAAAEWVKRHGGCVIGFVGFDGGRLKELCDVLIHISTPNGEYGPVEDAHLVVGHLAHLWLKYAKIKEKVS